MFWHVIELKIKEKKSLLLYLGQSQPQTLYAGDIECLTSFVGQDLQDVEGCSLIGFLQSFWKENKLMITITQ